MKTEIKIRKAIAKYLHPLKLNATISNVSSNYHETYIVDMDTRLAKKQGFDFDGLQIIVEDGIYEFSEFQAGIRNNELHIFGEYKTINAAFKRMLKGKIAPVKIYI